MSSEFILENVLLKLRLAFCTAYTFMSTFSFLTIFRYQIVKQPQFGNIQRLRAVDSSWINVDSFTSNQIHLGQVRYDHNTDFPVHDDFKVLKTRFEQI